MKTTLITILILLLFSMDVCLALTPLWIGIANGHSIYGGINNTPLSFGLAFIGTFLAINGGLPTIAIA